jgi:hypothetical protein
LLTEIISDQFQFFEQSTIKAIELMSTMYVTNMKDLESKCITITETTMFLFASRLMANSNTILNDVLKKKPEKKIGWS